MMDEFKQKLDAAMEGAGATPVVLPHDPMVSSPHETECHDCHGIGSLTGCFPKYSDDVPKEDRKPCLTLECARCNSSGKMPAEMLGWIARGADIKHNRILAGYGARQAAKEVGMEPTLLLAIEQGRVNNLTLPLDFTTPPTQS